MGCPSAHRAQTNIKLGLTRTGFGVRNKLVSCGNPFSWSLVFFSYLGLICFLQPTIFFVLVLKIWQNSDDSTAENASETKLWSYTRAKVSRFGCCPDLLHDILGGGCEFRPSRSGAMPIPGATDESEMIKIEDGSGVPASAPRNEINDW